MSAVMSATEWTDLLDKWGIKRIAVHSDWATHNRAGHGAFGDMHGIVVHHFGSHASAKTQNEVLWEGTNLGTSSELPGPLCHAGIQDDGTVALVGWGRTNHAGSGDSAILQHVIAEDYDSSKNLVPAKADTDGNAVFYGFEIEYDGETPMSDAQRKTIVRVCAAICTHHNWTAKSVIGHGEWQPGKWDPGAHGNLISMGTFRSEVEQAIKEGPQPPEPAKYKTITVAKGQTLAGTAKKYGISLEALINLNKGIIQPGDKLKVPNRK
jgi:LysM repeat protein